MNQITVCAFYKFVDFADFAEKREPLLHVLKQHEIYGTILLAAEGINGTVAGSAEAINNMLEWLAQDIRFLSLEYKLSYTDVMPFQRRKVKLKKEIVTMGVANIDPNHTVGTYVSPQEWNTLISDPEVLVIDTRNNYEYEIGTFQNAVNPQTRCFREFPQYVERNLEVTQHKKVAMFCTGGIRCEKATALLKQKGFAEVYHLKGGILKYLEVVPESESLWQGECFIFDERVSLNAQLKKEATIAALQKAL